MYVVFAKFESPGGRRGTAEGRQIADAQCSTERHATECHLALLLLVRMSAVHGATLWLAADLHTTTSRDPSAGSVSSGLLRSMLIRCLRCFFFCNCCFEDSFHIGGTEPVTGGHAFPRPADKRDGWGNPTILGTSVFIAV